MRQPVTLRLACTLIASISVLLGTLYSTVALADQVEMVNGDRYVGKVVSLGSETLVIQSEFLGTLKLPRSRIANIGFQAVAARAGTNANGSVGVLRLDRVAQSPARSTNSVSQFNTAMRELGTNSSLIQQVQQQLLSGAGPEAQNKFNDLVSGLLNGKIGVSELRNEAKTTLAQAKAARKELGEEGGSSIDSYLAILEGFLKETETTGTPTNGAGVVKSGSTRVPPVAPEE